MNYLAIALFAPIGIVVIGFVFSAMLAEHEDHEAFAKGGVFGALKYYLFMGLFALYIFLPHIAGFYTVQHFYPDTQYSYGISIIGGLAIGFVFQAVTFALHFAITNR
jgi:hypothetical protein